MATIGELIINLNASTAAFVTELERVKNLSFDTATQIQRSFNLIGTAAVGMIGVAAGAFAEGINKTVEWETHILHLAESAGASTEAISGLSLAAKMMGLDIDTITKALERFDKQLLQAGAGNQKSQQNLSMLGIDPAQIKTSDDALKQLADHFAAMPDGAVKSGEAMMAFGKAGAAMIPILNLGSNGIQDFIDEAGRMGLVITKDQAEQAEHFEQNITRMKESLHGLWVEITNATLPVLDQLTTKFQDTASKSGKGDAIWELLGAAFGNGSAGEGAPGTMAVEAKLTPTNSLGGRAFGPVPLNTNDLGTYLAQGAALIAQQEDMQQKVAQSNATIADSQKAIDALKKSYDGLATTLEAQIATMGVTNLQAKEYAINATADKAGIAGLTSAQEDRLRRLSAELTFRQQLADIDNATVREKKLLDTQNQIKADQTMADELKQYLDLSMQMQFAPVSAFTPAPETTQAFTASIEAQTAALEHQVATFGMSSEAIARYDLSQLDSSQAAQDQIAKFKALQDQMDAMNAHAKTTTEAWKQFGETAQRSLDDLIFSGKSFTQVLSDITKQLGEMFLKWALFGFGQSNTSSGGGLFGLLASSLGPIFGLAGGGQVAGGQTVMVGEQGPELFTPSTSGYVIPNGAGAGGSAVVNYYVDARGSSITEEQFKRSLAASEGRAVQRALNMTREAQLRTA